MQRASGACAELRSTAAAAAPNRLDKITHTLMSVNNLLDKHNNDVIRSEQANALWAIIHKSLRVHRGRGAASQGIRTLAA